MRKTTLAAVVFLSVGSIAAHAIEAGGQRFDDRIQLAGTDLVANGAGVRTRMVFDVYAMALYLPAKAATAEAVFANKGPRRIALQMMRDVGANTLSDALRDGMKANVSAAEFAALGPQIQQLVAALSASGEVKKGSIIHLDFVPGAGPRVLFGGKPQGKDIPGDTFYEAVMKIWLGANPVQSDLKNRLLGR